jgi:hypothetical protein
MQSLQRAKVVDDVCPVRVLKLHQRDYDGTCARSRLSVLRPASLDDRPHSIAGLHQTRQAGATGPVWPVAVTDPAH